jgi:hypothetical protein
MRALLLAGVPAMMLLFVACAGSVTRETTQGSGGSASTSSSTGADISNATSSASSASNTSSSSGGGVHGDCHSDADCNGMPCVPLTPGGYLVCLEPVAEATSCQVMGSPNQCCTAADCPSGADCYPESAVEFCGGAFLPYNECIADACASDADCTKSGPQQICAPAGAFGYPKRECLAAYCHTDADCTAQAGGFCAPIGGNPCCSLEIPDGLGCVYPGDCADGTACPNEGRCGLDATTGTSTCSPMGPGCPP